MLTPEDPIAGGILIADVLAPSHVDGVTMELLPRSAGASHNCYANRTGSHSDLTRPEKPWPMPLTIEGGIEGQLCNASEVFAPLRLPSRC